MHGLRAPESPPPPVDAAVAALAAGQHGVVARRQLTALGLGRGAIGHRVRCGRLHRLHRGVYAVGHPVLGREGRYLAAVLACGPGAAISHRSAAVLWELVASRGGFIELSCPRRCRPSPRLRVHRTGTLAERDTTAIAGVPVTSLARTLLDLADVAPARQVERALDQAAIQRRFDARALDDVLARAAGRRGAGVLRAALEEHRRAPTFTRSGLEEAFLALVRDARLPRPQTNVHVGGYEVDAYWPALRLAVELDGRGYHENRRAFEADRRRDIALQIAGVRTARFTDRRVADEPAEVLDELRALGVDSGAGRSS